MSHRLLLREVGRAVTNLGIILINVILELFDYFMIDIHIVILCNKLFDYDCSALFRSMETFA